MRLLIVTQKVDRSDPILGFFRRWVEEFAQSCDQVTVIGQYVQQHRFPSNVRVETLGKELKFSRFHQVIRFWYLIWALRSEYDAVLVHMTPVWIVLGAPLWWLLRKRRFLWYEARGKRLPLKLAVGSVQKVFSASQYGMPLSTVKSRIVGHGIDTAFFNPGDAEREPHTLLTVGRITKAKNLRVILQAFTKLPESYRLIIAGGPITNEDCQLNLELHELIKTKNLHRRVTIQCVAQDALRPLLQRASVFIHASQTSLDKAVLEAMASGCPVVSCAEAVKPLLPDICRATPETLAESIGKITAMSESERRALTSKQREYVEAEHGLPRLVGRLIEEMSVG